MEGDRLRVEQNGKTVDYVAEQIGCFILEFVKKSVCVKYKVPLSSRIKAVITAPAYFNMKVRVLLPSLQQSWLEWTCLPSSVNLLLPALNMASIR